MTLGAAEQKQLGPWHRNGCDAGMAVKTNRTGHSRQCNNSGDALKSVIVNRSTA